MTGPNKTGQLLRPALVFPRNTISTPPGATMPITPEDVAKTALLARLELAEDEKERLVEQLSSILDQIAVIAEVDTSAIPPTAQVVALHNAMRPDRVRPSLSPEQVLANAPDREDDFFKVRAVLARR